MSWTVACFCGTVFESPADRCPTCGTPVPEVTRAADIADPVRRPDGVAELQGLRVRLPDARDAGVHPSLE